MHIYIYTVYVATTKETQTAFTLLVRAIQPVAIVIMEESMSDQELIETMEYQLAGGGAAAFEPAAVPPAAAPPAA